jgi:excisionase family DNA binding protein
MLSPVLTVKDMATYLRVDQSTIYRLVRARKLPAFRVAGGWRFNLEHIKRWTRDKEVHPK